MPPLASLGDSFSSFFDAVGQFFSRLAHVNFLSLLLALVAFTVYLTLRARASFHILRAAYPDDRIAFRRIWGAYFAGYGFNSVIPARSGDVIRLFLTKTSVPESSYSAVAAAFFAQHPRFTLFVLTALGIAAMAAFALLSVRVRAFWSRVRQGLTILFDRRRYFREVWLVQLAGWLCRFTAFWCLLDAFHVGGSVRNVLLVLGVNAVAALVPFTPGGAGVQQALLVKVFGTGATVAAYSVGQQIAIAALTFCIGLAAVVWIFRFRSFKEVIAAGRASRAETA